VYSSINSVKRENKLKEEEEEKAESRTAEVIYMQYKSRGSLSEGAQLAITSAM
jgi:hypothetical protein